MLQPGSEVSRIARHTDLLPTFSSLAGYEVPSDRMIDGKDQFRPISRVVRMEDRDGDGFFENSVSGLWWCMAAMAVNLNHSQKHAEREEAFLRLVGILNRSRKF